MDAGNLFGDLIASVERAEKTVPKADLISDEPVLFSGGLPSQDLFSEDQSSNEISSNDSDSEEASPAEQSRPFPSFRLTPANLAPNANPPQSLKPEQLPQSLGLCPADGNLALLFIVHAQLVRTLEPGYDFANAIDIHQVRPVRPPE